jgi:hypothetical protein
MKFRKSETLLTLATANKKFIEDNLPVDHHFLDERRIEKYQRVLKQLCPIEWARVRAPGLPQPHLSAPESVSTAEEILLSQRHQFV